MPTLDERIAARRADAEFMRRIRRAIDRNRRALERLAR